MVRTHFHRLNPLVKRLAVIRHLQKSETGATAVEYGLLLAFIASAIIAVVILLGDQLVPGFQEAIDGF
jgi:pilus assembly protein Flp/PilA